MSRAVVLLMLVMAVAYTAAYPPQPDNLKECGPNEVFNSCGSPCQSTCERQAAAICTMKCQIGCECQKGFVRNKDKQCVLTRDC